MKTPAAALLLAWVLCLPGLLGSVSRSDPTAHMEALSIASSQFTWLRLHSGEADAWLVPTWNERPRIHKPPLVVWANLIAWTGLDPATAAPETLVLRARLAGLAMVMMTLFAAGWAGAVLGGRVLSFLAAAIFGTMFLTLKQTSIATYDTYLMGWTALSMAAGLHAMHARRGASGLWLLSGLFCGLALMTKGPVALVFTAAPLAALILFRWPGTSFPRRAGGLALALAAAAAVAAPWYGFIARTFPNLQETLATEYLARRDEGQPAWYYLGLVGLAFPWTLAFVPALLRRPRGAALKALVWLVVVVALMSIPGAKQQRYIVPVLPAVALVIAQFLLDRNGRPIGRTGRILFAAHVGLLAAATVLIPVFVFGQAWWIRLGWIAQPEIAGVPGFVVASVALVGALAVGLLERSRRAGFLPAAAVWTALWMSVTGGMLQAGYERSHHGEYEHREAAAAVRAITGGDTLAYLKPPDDWWTEHEPDEKFFFMMRRVIPPMDPAALSAGPGFPRYLLARDDRDDVRAAASAAGYVPVLSFHDGRRPRVLLAREAGSP